MMHRPTVNTQSSSVNEFERWRHMHRYDHHQPPTGMLARALGRRRFSLFSEETANNDDDDDRQLLSDADAPSEEHSDSAATIVMPPIPVHSNYVEHG